MQANSGCLFYVPRACFCEQLPVFGRIGHLHAGELAVNIFTGAIGPRLSAQELAQFGVRGVQ